MRSHGFARPNLLSRLYIGVAQSGFAADMYHVLDLAERMDPLRLRQAVSRLLVEVPQLRSRVARHWYGYRRVLVETAELRLEDVVIVSSDAEATETFVRKERDLLRELPIQVLLHQGATHDRLVVALHHSIADGEGLLFVVAALGERYGARPAGETILPAPVGDAEPRYRELLSSLSWSERWRALRLACRYLWDAAGLPGSGKPTELATFADRPLPARGRLRYTRIGVSFDEAAALMRWAVQRGGSLTDVLLTASLRAAIAVWPGQSAMPISVSLPVIVRSAADQDVANRVAVMDFLLSAGAFETMFAQVAAATAGARRLRPAVLNMFKFALASYLPPAVFEHFVRRYFSRSTNVRESLMFTVLGTFDGGPRRFGPVAVTDSFPLGSVIAPPGLKVLVSAHGGRLNLCIAYVDAVIGGASAAAFGDAISAELTSIAAAGGRATLVPPFRKEKAS